MGVFLQIRPAKEQDTDEFEMAFLIFLGRSAGRRAGGKYIFVASLSGLSTEAAPQRLAEILEGEGVLP